ncbi:MAG: ice-binding family protein [Bacteroidales bacterium]|nr:ice-binding family protein [Bacteroidales bacterium]
MKTKLQTILLTVFLFSIPILNFGQTPDLKTCADFILFTSSGGITNTGVSQILGGAIGINFGALTGFDDVNCVKHVQNAATIQCDLDLQAVYDEITAIVPTATITAASLDGATITPGIYKINEAVALTLDLTLDAQNNPDALFIFKIVGAFSTAASVNILLINGASVNNVFWHGTAAIGSGASASLKGTFMTNTGAIAFGAGTLLEGRALTVIGEVTISESTLTGCINPVATTVNLTQPTCSVFTGTIEVTAPLGAGMTYSIDGTDFTNTTGLFTKVPAGDYTVTSKNADGCLSMTDITLVGFKHAPSLGTVTDFVLFTSTGAVGNTGVSTITGGAIGTNAGAISGFDAVDCVKHVENAETAQAKLDLQAAFNELGAIQTTQTLTPAELSGATLTAGVYHINSAADLTVDLTLNAEGNPDAVFIFKVTGAFSVAALVDILLINGASVNNVFWRVDGAISAGAGSTLRGVFIALAGEVALGDGVTLEGRGLTIAGAIGINNTNVSVCIRPVDPIITLTQPNCSLNTGSITITTPIAAGMTYRIDYCAYSNTTGIFTDVAPGTYLVTAKDSEGCISDGTTVIINAESPDITWTGIENNDWSNIQNWNLAEIPGAYCDAIIPLNGIVNISSETTAESKGLSIDAGAVLTIEPGKTLTVYGTLTNNAGVAGLIIKSDATGTASLIHSTANVSASFERYMNDADWADWTDGWHFVSSPVATQAISPNFTVDPASDYDFYSWHEPSNLWVNFKNNINPPTWSTANTINNGLSNNSSNLLVGKGYMVAYNSSEVKVFSGNLNVADITVQDLTITGTSNANRSWHLLGNPFSTALTWDAGSDWNLTNIAGVAKIWNEALQAYSDLTSTPVSSIPATNGFMVQASTGTGSLTLPAAKRDHSAQAFYKNTVPIHRIVLMASPMDKLSGQHSTICFIPEATEDFDLMYDSEFLAGYAPKFYSISDDFKLSTNSLPSMNDEIVIPFGFVKNNASDYSIELTETIDGQMLYLSDLKTNTVHTFNNNPVYHFNSEEGDNPNRFLLYFGTVGIDNLVDNESFRTYFSGGNLYMMIPDGKAVLEVFDILGRMVQSKAIFGEGLHSQPFNQPPGFYIVRLLGENGAKTVKIIVD